MADENSTLGELMARERRAHARIQVSTNVELAGPRGRHAGILMDLSLSGARVFVAEGAGNIGESIELVLSRQEGGTSGFMSRIVRVEKADEGSVVALLFVLSDDAAAELQVVLAQLLHSGGGGKREHARLARRIPVRYESRTELKGVLEDISSGGLSMTVSAAVSLDQEVLIAIPDSAGEDLISVRARVVRARRNNRTPPSYRVGLRFTKLSPERQYLLSKLFELMIEST